MQDGVTHLPKPNGTLCDRRFAARHNSSNNQLRHNTPTVYQPPVSFGGISIHYPTTGHGNTDLERTNLGTYQTRLDLGRLIKPMQAVGRRSDKPTNL